jgi:hypothetical protein
MAFDIVMRRYRFVEDGLVIGRPETLTVVKQARAKFKLWNRVDAQDSEVEGVDHYTAMTARSDELVFDGLSGYLEASKNVTCQECQEHQSCKEDTLYGLGGVRLCDECRDEWGAHIDTFPNRFASVFPEVTDEVGLGCL